MGNEMVIVRNPDDLALWQDRIQECRNSGQTVVAWCAEKGISEKTYYYWHRKLARGSGKCSDVQHHSDSHRKRPGSIFLLEIYLF